MKHIKFIVLLLIIALFVLTCKSKEERLKEKTLKNLSHELNFYNRDIKYRGSVLLPEDPKEKFVDAVKKYNMNIIRVSGGESDPRFGDDDCFLYNDLENFSEVDANDLKMLDRIYGWTSELGIQLIIDHHHAAGRQWGYNIADYRLFEDFKYHRMTTEFWIQMEEHFKDRPDVVFGLLNEPYYFNHFAESEHDWNISMDGPYVSQSVIDEYMAYTKGTPADLNLLYGGIIKAIRATSPGRIIMIEPDKWAGAEFLQTLDPIYKADGTLDENIWYSFHFYEPHPFTHDTNEMKGEYPGLIESKWVGPQMWDKETLRGYFERVEKWRTAHNIPREQIICSEFNTTRWVKGAVYWLSDLVNLLEEYGYNWTYYMFREDEWDNMDLELGTDRNNKKRHNDSILMHVLHEKFKRNY